MSDWSTFLIMDSTQIGVNIYPYFSTAQSDGEAWELLNQPVGK